MRNFMDLMDPPVGKVEAKVFGLTSFIRWAPGNGLVYVLIVSPVIDEIKSHIGGSVLLSVLRRDGKAYATYPGNPSGIYHLSFVEEKWGSELGEEGTCYFTALLNWALFGDDELASEYAQEIFDAARKKWQS